LPPEKIMDGDTATAAPLAPLLWVIPANAEPTYSESIRERWRFEISLVAVVDGAPEVAGREALRIALAASRACVRVRSLGLRYVQDVRRGRVEPARRGETAGRFGAGVTLFVDFAAIENEYE
jgi:hypothetical protein